MLIAAYLLAVSYHIVFPSLSYRRQATVADACCWEPRTDQMISSTQCNPNPGTLEFEGGSEPNMPTSRLTTDYSLLLDTLAGIVLMR